MISLISWGYLSFQSDDGGTDSPRNHSVGLGELKLEGKEEPFTKHSILKMYKAVPQKLQFYNLLE